jgi:hypothetical protein
LGAASSRALKIRIVVKVLQVELERGNSPPPDVFQKLTPLANN